MPFIDTKLLQQEQLPEKLIEEYREAVEAAWAEIVPGIRGLGSRPLMSLRLQDPGRDRQTVSVHVGISAQYGATAAKSPADLREALVKHFRDRFIPRDPTDSGLG